MLIEGIADILRRASLRDGRESDSTAVYHDSVHLKGARRYPGCEDPEMKALKRAIKGYHGKRILFYEPIKENR